MKLTRVTLTGADDSVDPRDLVRLSALYPYVEWGVLFSITRQGLEPRYPNTAWIHQLLEVAAGTDTHLAQHVCGSLARQAFEGQAPPMIGCFPRIQLNGFVDWLKENKSVRLNGMLGHSELEFILQVDGSTMARDAVDMIRFMGVNASRLWDCSGGTGAYGFEYGPNFPPAPPLRGFGSCGYAGGIGPGNILDVLCRLALAWTHDVELWVDMESSLRSPDGKAFDLRACETVLEAAAPFVAGARPALGATR